MTIDGATRRAALAAALLAAGWARALAAVCPLTAGTAGCGGNVIYVTQGCTTGISPSTSTINDALSILAQTPGPACAIIEDNGVYAESVVISSYPNNGSTLSISVDPGVAGQPTVSPPAGSTAAFLVGNSNVDLSGFAVSPSTTLPYGILASSPTITINDVVVIDTIGAITTAGVSLSTGDTLTLSTINLLSSPYAVLVANAANDTVAGNNLLGNAGSGYGIYATGTGSSVTLSSDTIADFPVGLYAANLGTPTSLLVSSLTFVNMPANATAIDLNGGIIVSTFTDIMFNSASISTNVNTGGLSLGSSIVMAAASGVRAGPPYEYDPGGYVQWTSTGAFDPLSTVVFPVNGSVFNTFSVISGTAGAFGLASIAAVQVVIKDVNTGLYWNGVAFSSATPAVSTAAFVGVSSGTWTLPLSTSVLTNGSSYVIKSLAVDSLGDYQTQASSASFIFDIPASSITFPESGAFIAALPAITGTAGTSATASVSTVDVSVENLATGLYWNGSSFADAVATFNAAAFVGVSSGVWSYSGVISTSLASGTSYYVQSGALDSLGGIQNSTTTATFLFDNTPPTIVINVPVQGAVYTSLPAISGTSADNVYVASVGVRIENLSSSQCFNAANGAFNLSCASAFIPVPGSTAAWSYAASSVPWVSGTQYLVTAEAFDEAGNSAQTSAAFAFQASTTLASGNPGDGQGAAALTPSASAGCQLITATAAFTTGPLGISTGGVVAFHIPPGWSQPQGSAPGSPGYTQILSTTGFGVLFNPPQLSSATLGTNWIVYLATAPLSPGQPVQFVYSGLPPAGTAAQAAQPFAFSSQGGANGNLTPLPAPPSMTLSAGAPATLAFSPSSLLLLGPLQASPTMQLQVTDACGASTPTASDLTVNLTAAVGGNADAQAQFFNIGGSTISSVALTTGASVSPAFSFNSSTTGVTLENIVAQTFFSTAPATAVRTVQRLAAAPSINNASVDTGTPGSAQTATLTEGSASAGQVFINFTLSNPSLNWEVVISSQPGFASQVAEFFGTGNPGRGLTWNGTYQQSSTPQYLPAGVYYVEITAAQGAAVNTSLTISVSSGGWIYGSVSNGPGAAVSAAGPSTSQGNSVVASSTGFFQIFGLQSGAQYTVTAVSTAGLTASVYGVTASASGTNAGTLSFPGLGTLNVSAALPFAAPSELFGSILAHTTSYAQTGGGALHFALGSASSDNGAQQFGQTASTWTQISLPPGVYEVDASLPALGISTSIFGVTVASNSTTSLPITLSKLANVYGYAMLPSVAVSSPVAVSVQAQAAGAPQPSVFGGALVPVGLSSAVYSLFGLAPGSWTVTTAAPGYVAASSPIFIAGAADIGTSSGGGFNIGLTVQASAVTGLLTVVGNTAGLAPLSVPVYIDNGAAPALTVSLATNAVQTSSTFSVTGLSDGGHTIWANLAGYNGDTHSFTVAEGLGSASLVLSPTQSDLVLTFKLPGGAHPPSDFAGVTFGLYGQNFGQRGPDGTVYPPNPAANWTSYGTSSAAVALGGLTADVTQIQAFYSGNGAYEVGSLIVTPGATSYLTLDLSSPSYSVGGTLLLTQSLNVPQNGYSVNVSSIAGLLANTGTTSYCLLGSTLAQTAPFAHLELLPQSAGTFSSGPLPFAAAAGCAGQQAAMLTPPGAGPQPYWAYVSTMDVNGNFLFPAVPPGVYLLRDNPVIDANGDLLPKFSQVVIVTSSVSGLIFQLGSGNAVAGSLLAPPGTTLNRQFLVSLTDAQGNPVAQAQATFAGTGSAGYLIAQVPSGAYSLQVQDSAYPKAYAAAPLAVRVAGQDVLGQNIPLSPSGTINLRAAVQQAVPGASPQFILINQYNQNLLPPGLSIEAVADPWFNGGLAFAAGPAGSTVPVLNANGQFVIDGLLPGTYDVKFLTPTGAYANASVSGVTVGAGNVSDLGIVNLGAAAQLSGQVFDAVTGAPLPNVAVEARPSLRGAGFSAAPIDAITDVSGRYTLAGLSPSVRYYDLFAASRGDSERQGESLPPYQQTALLSVDVTSGVPVNFSVPRAPYSISGQALASGGQPLNLPFPVGGAAAQGQQLGADILLQKVGVAPVKNPVADIIFATDLNGNFSIPSLSSGTYELTVNALGYAYAAQLVTITTASVSIGGVSLSAGASLSGSLLNPDGSEPSASQAAGIIALGSGGGTLIGSLTTDPNTQGVSGYQISGFKPGPGYRLLILDSGGNFASPPEASSLVFTSTVPQTLNIVYRAVAPLVTAKAGRQGSNFLVEFDVSQPLREKTAQDDNLPALLSTAAAAGTLGQYALSADRTQLTAVYTPGVSESSFTLQLGAYSAVVNPGSLDPVNPQYPVQSLTTFYIGIDGLGQSNVANFQGGNVLVSGNAGRVVLPPSAFNVAASSSVQVTLQLANEALTGLLASSLKPGGRLSALRYAPQAYPPELVAAAAAVPPDINPFSPFYSIFLPIGINHALSAPSALTLSYSSGTDPSTLNVYWYNSAANEYVLQPDVTGAVPLIDPVARTVTINVNHFSTFVLFASGQSAITGATGATAFSAYNFPNPFDLTTKTVTPLHAVSGDNCDPSCSVRGTMIAVSVPPGISGDGTIRIFNVAGVLVKTIDAGSLTGGSFYYQNWDGTNDGGRDVASGVYIGELKVGGQSTFFKMAVIKGSNK